MCKAAIGKGVKITRHKEPVSGGYRQWQETNLILISIEVIMIAAVMLTGDNNPALARDTLFSVLIFD